MRSSAGIWVLGGTASLALNLGVAAALMAAMQPQPIADQPVPESRLNVEAQAVTRSEATAQEPQSQTATEGAAKGPNWIMAQLRNHRPRPKLRPLLPFTPKNRKPPPPKFCKHPRQCFLPRNPQSR
ncbi:hypothetical protein ACFQDZ_27575 [Sulfitobacter pacificus]|uniref:hypothetical protein n=1 Tax=Sulfitobacter pacificus TaxID=1499314 RepID=UPI0036086B2D